MCVCRKRKTLVVRTEAAGSEYVLERLDQRFQTACKLGAEGAAVLTNENTFSLGEEETSPAASSRVGAQTSRASVGSGFRPLTQTVRGSLINLKLLLFPPRFICIHLQGLTCCKVFNKRKKYICITRHVGNRSSQPVWHHHQTLPLVVASGLSRIQVAMVFLKYVLSVYTVMFVSGALCH